MYQVNSSLVPHELLTTGLSRNGCRTDLMRCVIIISSFKRWSYFTFIYYRSSNMNYFIYTSHHFTHRKIWTQLIDLAPNVWLHSSVGRASHRYRGGHGFESRWTPDFFQASSFQLLKLENLLRWSYFTFIYYRSSNMNYFIYTSDVHLSSQNNFDLSVGEMTSI